MSLGATRLKELLAAEFAGEWRDDLASITGPRSDEEIGLMVERLVQDELGQKMRGALFVAKSVGAVFGLELASGEKVVLKLFHPSQSLAQLAAAHRILTSVVASGFPAPPPRSPLFRVEDGSAAAFYAFVDGTTRDGHEPTIRRELAQRLARLTEILALESAVDLPLAPTREGDLWPAPHRSFVTLDEVPDARWIDDVGFRAQTTLKALDLPLMPAHLDWGVKNARFHQDRLCVVYDWDSLFAACEAEMVGRAAVQFTAQWDFPARLVPSPAEVRAFVCEYEAARGRAFFGDERPALAAGAEYALAQIARLEVASGNPRPDGFLSLLQAWKSDTLLEPAGT